MNDIITITITIGFSSPCIRTGRRFDLGFEPQITKVLENTRPDRQTVFFSATFPKQMESLAKKHLRHPIEMVVGGRSVVR